MMNSVKALALFIILTLSFTSLAGNNTSERISGVADFLIERANDNYLYIFQKKIQNNQQLRCYFPTTYENLAIGGSTGLKTLLTSRTLWKESIQYDLEFLTIRSLAKEIETTFKVSKGAADLSSKALDILNLFELKINGQAYPLNFIPDGIDQQSKNRINGFSYDLGIVIGNLNKFRHYRNLCPELTNNMAEFKSIPKSDHPINISEFKKEFDSLRLSNEHLNRWIKHIESNAGDLILANNSSNSNISWESVCKKLDLPQGSCSDGKSTVKAFKQYQLAKLIDPAISKNINVIKETIESFSNNKEQIVKTAIRDAICKKMNIIASECTDKQAVTQAIQNIVNAKSGSAGNSPGAGLIDAGLLEKIKSIQELTASLPVRVSDVTSQVFVALKKIKEDKTTEIAEKYQPGNTDLDKPEALEAETSELKIELDKLDKLSKYVLFFASVADASSASEVSSILKNYTLPSVSFFEKRKEGNHFMVTSYLGVSYNLNEDNQTEKSNNGIFVPIGLEYSRGVNWFGGNIASASVMVSPFDFGHPVNLKLNDIEQDFEFDEVIAPSVTFAMGLKDYPLTFGLGYQKGRQLVTSNETENRVIVFFAFDMPLISLHGD